MLYNTEETKTHKTYNKKNNSYSSIHKTYFSSVNEQSMELTVSINLIAIYRAIKNGFIDL